MEEKLVEVIVQGGVLGGLCFYLIFSLGGKVDRLLEAIAKLPKEIGDSISRVIHR